MNVTPFVDVMLVLLIIFMIAAPLSTVTVPVELPPATTKPADASKPRDPVFVSLEKSGALFVMDAETSLAQLPERLREQTAGDVNERIYLRADQSLPYRRVMQVMNVLQDAGFYRVGLVAEEIEAGS
ncbi:MAG TPA: biopolymer transporter ExbD [Myxococcota bacterium]